MGLPATIRVDQGTEFVSRDLDLWAYQRGVSRFHTLPAGNPIDNAFSKPSMVASEPECLNAHWFLSLADVQMEDWRKYYNEERPHGAIGQKTPLCCPITLAQPARHREKAGKIYLRRPKVWASLHTR